MTGTYDYTFLSQDSCDSIVNLDVTIEALLSTSIDAEICAGETYSIAGISYSTTGIHQETTSSLVTGCDSTITLNLTVNPVQNTNLTESILSLIHI